MITIIIILGIVVVVEMGLIAYFLWQIWKKKF